MHWLELHIDTTHDGLDPVTALLSSLGIDNVMIDDEEEFRSFLEETRPTGIMWTRRWSGRCGASPA